MKVIIILAAIAFTHGAKLERTYLPPSNARTAGGSGNFLETPFPGSSGSSRLAGARARNTYQNGNTQAEFGQSQNGFSQSGNGFSQTGNDYSQSGNGFPQSGNGFLQSGPQYDNVNNFEAEARPERPRAAFERNAAILRQDNSNDGETYSYAFETENGIYAEESGVATNGVEAQGGYSYTGDDGKVYSVRYTADQNGFVPVGEHIPTPPPVPEEIQKALEQNARDEAAGIFDDGSYSEGKYSTGDNNNYNGQVNYQQNTGFEDIVVTNSALARSGPASYNAPRNGPAYNNPNAAIAPTYGTPNAGNAPSFQANAAIAPSYGAPNAQDSRTYNAPNAGNAPSFNSARTGNARLLNSGISRNSGVEKAYLPPFADQRGQTRNGFGRRQQNFNANTGYQY